MIIFTISSTAIAFLELDRHSTHGQACYQPTTPALSHTLTQRLHVALGRVGSASPRRPAPHELLHGLLSLHHVIRHGLQDNERLIIVGPASAAGAAVVAGRPVIDRPDAWEFLDHVAGLLGFLLPRFQKEGKSYLTVAIGCTGGQHRSVYLAERLGQRFANRWVTLVRHREVHPGLN